MSGFDVLKETINPDPGQASKEIFFTQKGNILYAILPIWPEEKIVIKDFYLKHSIEKATLLASNIDLETERKNDNLIIYLPKMAPYSSIYPTTLKLKLNN